MDGTTEVDTFNVDLSSSIALNAEPERVHVSRGDDAVLPGYRTTFSVRLYPIENQMADKLCAMYTSLGSGPSTRYRDLYDLAMVVDQLRFDPTVLAQALRVQEQIRGIKLPAQLADPGTGWADAYTQQMQKTPGATGPFIDYDSAMTVVARAVTPSLPASAK